MSLWFSNVRRLFIWAYRHRYRTVINVSLCQINNNNKSLLHKNVQRHIKLDSVNFITTVPNTFYSLICLSKLPPDHVPTLCECHILHVNCCRRETSVVKNLELFKTFVILFEEKTCNLLGLLLFLRFVLYSIHLSK